METLSSGGEPTPRRRRPALTGAALLALGVVAGVALGAAGLVPAALRPTPVSPTASPRPTTSDARLSLPAVRGATAVTLPAQVVGMTLRHEFDGVVEDDTAVFLRGLRNGGYDVTKSVSGLYVHPRASSALPPLTSPVTLFAAQSENLDADAIFKDWLMPSLGRAARKSETLDAWPYEGNTMCWLTTTYFCAWADRTSFGVVSFNATAEMTTRAHDHFAAIRAAVEQPIHPQ
ncbi:hypothetical protein [Nonomuraea pusilla]|uniref:Uncharacterized protein n=1 Tax=Nonomuraea pusilla TaxID=46177 RepID=A0A1H8ETU8_9ACTN|nr:hypothetical protein [Nonomuraea pusilla]SEN22902.1 hypothetical protein SAMN05660976_07104 [Nonomuraea pusilla]